MSSVFNDLMADLVLWHMEFNARPSANLEEDSARHTQLESLNTGIMNTDPLNACRCFMVDFLGTGAVVVPDGSIGEVLVEAEVDNLQAMIDRGGGALAAEVRKFLSEEKHSISDIGGGVIGWHLGVHCSPGEAWLLMHRGRQRFAKALRNGLLDIRLNPWSIKPYYNGE
jgi:hypothetical protein